MIELQRASAGSGKTYALAKKFIWYFITIKTDPDTEYDGPGIRRLRTPAELADSLSHIMAVTFTNKATNEMQLRIVDKLAALAAQPVDGKAPDYMEDFLADLNIGDMSATREQIRETCRRALSLLLNGYSDFHVSTIDSFFQQVLRTFAYESEISDSYQLELDVKYLARLSVDSLLENINNGTADKSVTYWIKRLMERNYSRGDKWNVFNRAQSGFSEGNLYSELIRSVEKLENEEFKQKRTKIDEYFARYPDLPALYEDLTRKYDRIPLTAFKTFVSKLKEHKNLIDSLDIVPADTKTFLKPVKTADKYRYDSVMAADEPLWMMPEDGEWEFMGKKAYLGRKKKDPDTYEMAEDSYRGLMEAANGWIGMLNREDYRHWTVYQKYIPFLGLLKAVRDERERFLIDNNAVELGETNSMLRTIIDKDTTPFIYERLGTHLRHFLIDEFQDTSRMQWENLQPLLDSFIDGNGSLIIGDAKQSIYRFRNADSSLISRDIPEIYGFDAESDLKDVKKNTNWRSAKHIVQFNNAYFRYLSDGLAIDPATGAPREGRRDFRTEYTNVRQLPHKREESGYVEVMLVNGNDPVHREAVPGIIAEAVSRGFRMDEIAVLVWTRSEGTAIIDEILKYNADPHCQHRIEFVSEESLKLSSSEGVAYVINILETIGRGLNPEIRTKEERYVKGVADWLEIKSSMMLYLTEHPELKPYEALDRFLESNGDENAIRDMLSGMQCVSLPALVEAITGSFLPDRLRQEDAVFISALQDAVMEYCEHNLSDIPSFLKWWDSKKDALSISSPEGTEAVQIMTIHKSKGLEFRVVIVPFANDEFADNADKPEWRWVRPGVLHSDVAPLPYYLPVDTTEALGNTIHEEDLLEYYDFKKADNLNLSYVAFTRAVDELYIIAAVGNEDTGSRSQGYWLDRFTAETLASGAEPESDIDIDPGLMERQDDDEENNTVHGVERIIVKNLKGGAKEYERFSVVSYGKPFAAAGRPREEENGKGSHVLSTYNAAQKVDMIEFVPGGMSQIVDAEDFDGEGDSDPRSIGNLLHAVMENVEVASDVDKAVRKLVISGLLDADAERQVRDTLAGKMAAPEVRSWFDGSMRVMTERPILRPASDKKGSDMPRPDRLMVTPEGDAVVVDYKFGESHGSDRRYRRQVEGYMSLLRRTGMFRSVTGYLWYVRLGEVVPVE